jgi:hypothetical protein
MAIDLRGRSSVSFYDTFAEFPVVGSDIVLYVDRDTLTMYIWNGSTYESFSGGGGGSTITVVANYAALPDPTTVSGQFYWCSASQGTYWLPGSLGGTYYNAGLYYSNGVSWEYTPTPYNASQAAVDAGTNDDQFVTPKTLETKPLAVSRTGTSISFDKIATYNSPALPATGNITNDLTGARIGVVQKIYHNNSVAPTFPAGWVKIEGDYVISIENIIFAEWISGTRVEYWVVNDAPSGFVPYTGATADVNLGTFHLDAAKGTFTHSGSTDTLTATHSSGSGIGLLITKGGNNEGLKVNKTSGSGNAATIIGTLEATTLVKTGGTSSQFLMADGTTSVQSNPFPLFGAGITSVVAGPTTRFLAFLSLTTVASENQRQIPVPYDVTFKNFFCFFGVGAGQSATGSLVLTIRKNGVDTAITLTIPAGSSIGTFSDTTNSESFVAGDLISVKAVNNASVPSGNITSITLGTI